MGMKKSDRFPGIPGLPLLGANPVVGSLDASPDEWVDPTVAADEPTSRYRMPNVPPGYDWMVQIYGADVTVILRKQSKPIRKRTFQYSEDEYIIANQAVVVAESILRETGPLRHVDLTCLENFTPGVGVVVK